MSPLNTLTQHSMEYSRLNSFDILLSLDDDTLFSFEDDEDLVVHTGATSTSLFFKGFSLSPVKHDKSMDYIDVKLSSNLSRLISPEKDEANDGFAEGVSNLISPEKEELVDGLSSVVGSSEKDEPGGLAHRGLLDLLVGHLENLYVRVESLENHVQRLESMQCERGRRRSSGISSITHDPPSGPGKSKVSEKKRSLIKQMFRLRLLRGKSVTNNPNRAEV